MARNYYKVSFKSNFSFQKLSQNLNAVIDDSNLDISTAIAKNTKKNIMDGLSPALKESTLRQRREGRTSFSDHDVTKKPGETRPLLYSGRLHDSIAGTKEGLEIMDYYEEHEKGFSGTHGRVPARPFVAKLEDNKEDLAKVQTSLVNRMNKAMKK